MAKSNNLLGNILDALGDAVQSKPASRQNSGLDGMIGELLEGMIGKEQKPVVRKNETENSGSLPDAISNLVEDMIAPGNKSASATAKKTGKQKSSAASNKAVKKKATPAAKSAATKQASTVKVSASKKKANG